MPGINPYAYKADELRYMMSHRCKHGHTYIEHPNCYYTERRSKPKIGFIDIETTGFKADFDIMLTYCIKVEGEKTILEGRITQEEILSGEFDKRLCKELLADMMKFDILIGYYSTRFDIPFIRTRMLMNKIDFPGFGCVQHKDLYYMVKSKLQLHRNSLAAATRALGIAGKNNVEGNHWLRARYGDEKALDYVLDHNERDVIITEKLWKKLNKYVKPTTRSI